LSDEGPATLLVDQMRQSQLGGQRQLQQMGEVQATAAAVAVAVALATGGDCCSGLMQDSG